LKITKWNNVRLALERYRQRYDSGSSSSETDATGFRRLGAIQERLRRVSTSSPTPSSA